MRLNYVLILVLGCTISVTAQIGSIVQSQPMRYDFHSGGGSSVFKGAKESKIKGSKLVFDNWKTVGTITTSSGTTFKMQRTNYDAQLDRVVVQMTHDSIFIFDPQTLTRVIINNRVFKGYHNLASGKNGFYELIASTENFELLKRYKAGIKEGTMNPMTQEKQTADRFLITSAYWLKKKDKMPVPFSIRKRKFLAIFGEKSAEIKEYISKNKLSIKKDVDLKKIFSYYEEIFS